MVRILVILLAFFLGACVICAGAGYFIALPRMQDALEENVEEAIATYVAPHIAGIDVTPTAGTHTLTETDVNREIQEQGTSLEDLVVAITPDYLEIRFGQQGQEITYRASAVAENGRLAIVDPRLDGVPDWIIPVDTVTDGLERGINQYLSANGLVLTDVGLGQEQMTFVTENA
jgi:hypothetical protein